MHRRFNFYRLPKGCKAFPKYTTNNQVVALGCGIFHYSIKGFGIITSFLYGVVPPPRGGKDICQRRDIYLAQLVVKFTHAMGPVQFFSMVIHLSPNLVTCDQSCFSGPFNQPIYQPINPCNIRNNHINRRYMKLVEDNSHFA